MFLIAIIDPRCLGPEMSLATKVAGLSLLERQYRLASVCGATTVYLINDSLRSPLPAFRARPNSYAPFETLSTNELSARLAALPVDQGRVLYLRADIVVERHLLLDALKTDQRDIIGPQHSFGILSFMDAPLALEHDGIQAKRFSSLPSFRAPHRWHVRLHDTKDILQAEHLLFEGCRKPQDGIISQLLNRHLSLFLSRRLVSSFVRPNHISLLTFSLGILAALAAAYGHYSGFFLAGLLYQLNSIVDGVDGELARVRYEFSVLGEWLDTISDDLSDFLFYLGLGYGAWQTALAPPLLASPRIWLYLGLAAAFGKLLSVIIYYRQLIRIGRGDLLAFQWSFEGASNQKSHLARFLSFSRYFFRKDFIVFLAFLVAIPGYLPHLLIALAPGNLLVALSVLLQSLRNES